MSADAQTAAWLVDWRKIMTMMKKTMKTMKMMMPTLKKVRLGLSNSDQYFNCERNPFNHAPQKGVNLERK